MSLAGASGSEESKPMQEPMAEQACELVQVAAGAVHLEGDLGVPAQARGGWYFLPRQRQ